jgi:hypothetical protein
MVYCLVLSTSYFPRITRRWIGVAGRYGDTVFFSHHESWGVVSVVADPDQDSLFSVVTGMCLSDWFRGKCVDRDTTLRIAKRCWY